METLLPVVEDETAGFDDVDADAEAGPEPNGGVDILRDIRSVEDQPHNTLPAWRAGSAPAADFLPRTGGNRVARMSLRRGVTFRVRKAGPYLGTRRESILNVA